jgi:glyoxylase-like metal-dependent hydrolase (beta-lactamase superfamily II)
MGELGMKYGLIISAALLATTAFTPASAQTNPNDLIKLGVEAQGGADAMRAIKTLVSKGEAKHWEPGQSYSVNGESRPLGDSTFTLSVDYNAPLRVRFDWDRNMIYPAVEKLKYSEIFYPTFGAVIDDKGMMRPMSGVRFAAENRERGRGSPMLLLRALDNPQNVSAIADQKLGDKTLPAAVFTQGQDRYVIIFDPATKLPAAVRVREADNIWGDQNYDLVLSDWHTVNGVKVAAQRATFLGNMEISRMNYKDVAANTAIPANTFEVPDAVKASFKQASGPVPHQWVLRRIFLGRFTDSDKIYFGDDGSFKLVELAPNVQMVQGGGANNLIVNTKDGIVVVDAPTDEGQSKWVIDAAKAKYPGKPIKTLVLTHHHMDHTGGMRAFVAEGANIIVPAQDKAYFEKVANAPHTLDNDAQQKANKPANVEGVADTKSIKDDQEEINLLNIPNPHVDGMLLVHLPKENILWVTDLVSPRGPVGRNPGTVAVGEALRKHNITGATIAGGHGATTKQADIAPALAAN